MKTNIQNLKCHDPNITYQFLYTQDDELERPKRSPRDRQYDDDIEYDMGEPVQMGHFKFMDELFPEDPE